ncbi:element excision factor XisI family protein [Roseofilum casamattae]|uniref:Element excision factor XisI family protein n=1 Tax=Roseofilum casamattae BLCC-M143 TaxID=3022442 RepID=A0ABT7C183_9CYAN|nr:element excision factor XisI family protein [Roseofilum casamattae]MDJ1185220.1 element excision factor XisI family protein [Roseofilum casamattae BLCC-M143]
MESRYRYLNILETIIRDYYNWVNDANNDTDEYCLIIDRERGYFLLHSISWEGDRRYDRTMIFVRLKNDKIWIETDETKRGITPDLLQAGIPNTEIVLGFLPPSKRPLSDFALC